MSRIVVKCPNCAKPNAVGSEHAGKNARCGACQAIFRVAETTTGSIPGEPPSPSEDANPFPKINTGPPPVKTPSAGYAVPPSPPSAGYAAGPSGEYGPSADYGAGTSSPGYAQPGSDARASMPDFLQGMSTTGTPSVCPYCHSSSGYYFSEQISTAGWVTFAVLMVTCWPLFWIGLLIKEQQTHCRTCHVRLR